MCLTRETEMKVEAMSRHDELLTPTEWEQLTRREHLDVGRFQSFREPGGWAQHTFAVDLDATPLAILARCAAAGHRVHEFMTIERPGDVLRYLWVHMGDVDDEVVERVKESMANRNRHVFDRKAPLDGLPFADFDRSFWRQESGRVNPDMDSMESTWYRHRQTDYWPRKLDGLMKLVESLHDRLRQCSDPLLRREITLIDRRTHRRDYWAHAAATGHLMAVPDAQTSLPTELFELLRATVQREDVRSVSCPLQDYALWRMLVSEQIRRATSANVAPQDALFLAGPDSGIPDVAAEDWGGHIHIPYEGACEADLFVKPDWHGFDKYTAAEAGTVRAGFFGKAHRCVLSRVDLGRFDKDERVVCGEWYLYLPRRAD